MKRSYLAVLLASTIINNGISMPSIASEIQFVEDFALADDREQALDKLVPGSEPYYFYSCLHLQHSERFDDVEQLLKRWIKQHGNTHLVRQIQHRQALLTYEQDPKQTLEYLRTRLNLNFSHQRERLNQKPNLPIQLDPNLISRQRFSKIAFQRHRNLDGFNSSALEWLVDADLNPIQRRHLLERLDRPDHENLVDLVVKDLRYKGSRGFGSLSIHRLLLPEQLDACIKAKPDLQNDTQFVNTYISKLWPGHDDDWRNDREVLSAYLDRLWKFIQPLKPVHNSLKTHVLYHKLALDHSNGQYNKRLFMEYLAIPRSVGYLPRPFRETPEAQRYSANLGQDYRNVTMLPAIGNDEPLVRDYLSHFFEKETNYKPYQPYVTESYLKELFAETKIVNGLGDAEQLYAMLSPEKYRALRDRVDLDFAPDNQTYFHPNDSVAFDVYVKNVETLIVKVYEINTRNYYQRLGQEVNTNVNLDGLIANVEDTHEFNEPPLRRIRRHFEFPELTKPGTYVVDFIGNGKSSRVVVRKGRLQFLERTTAAGHIVNVLDEDKNVLADATVWLSGHEYAADEDGDILIPFTTEPGRQAIILTAQGRSSLHFFQHQAERYQFRAGFYVDRESLLSNRKAKVIVRPSLTLNGTPVSLTSLKDLRLLVTSTDHDGTNTTQDLADFRVYEDRESEHEFQVPPRLANISFQLSAKVDVASTGKDQSLATSESFAINGIERSEKIDDLYFSKVGSVHLLELLGRTGEPKANRPVRLRIKHRDFAFDVSVTLQTDANGRIQLGELTDIVSVAATSPAGQTQTWRPRHDRFTYYRSIHATTNDPIRLPYLGVSSEPKRNEMSLLELRGRTFAADHFDKLAIQDGFLVATGLPAGDFDLWLKQPDQRFRLRVTEGSQRDRHALGKNRHLELRNPKPMHITGVEAGDEKLTVQLGNVNPFTRVHVVASRFEPAHDAYGLLSRVRDVEPTYRTVSDLKALYLAGRNIGDEYRYILDRRYIEKFPGNMLQRPSLLLNPWDIRSTETGDQQAEKGEAFAPSADDAAESEGRDTGARGGRGETGDFHCLDFLRDSAVVLVNLIPDKDGRVTIDRSDLGTHQQLQIVAVDPLSTVRRNIALGSSQNEFEDLRLIVGLDPAKHFTQQKHISVVQEGEVFRLRDITTSQFAAYDSLESIFRLYTTLTNNAHLAEFEFIIRWPELDEDEKREKYAEYACHELNYFIYKKDPNFFAAVVQPYLANKLHKTFLDQWLLQRDLQSFVEPWNHARLNIVERILLGQQFAGEQPFARRHVNELFELLPPNTDRWNQLFHTALMGQSLQAQDRFGFAGKAVDELSRLREEKRAAEPAAGAVRGLSTRFAAPQAAAESLSLDDKAVLSKSVAAGEPTRAKRRLGRANRNELADMEGETLSEEDAAYFFERASGRKQSQLFRKLDKTKEWVENNYYRLPIGSQDASLITVNSFWNDFAQHAGGNGFFSADWADASRNFTEMMFALSVLDLPFRAADHEVEFDGIAMTLRAKTPLVVVHEQIREVDPVQADSTAVLVSQDFYRYGERHRQVDGQQVDNFITDEFLVHTLYGSQVVVTNTSSTRQKIDVLLQIPIGAIPALNSRSTRSVHVELEPYHTQTLDYFFYFPAAGDFDHFPVHVAKNEILLATATPRKFDVVDEPSQLDKESWQYVSQFGTNQDVMTYLETHNVQDINLAKVAFRMRDKDFFTQALDLLSRRHVFDATLWSYGIHHNDVVSIRQLLQHRDGFVNECGPYLDSRLLTIDPVVRRSYEHMDYKPLVNARAHQLGRTRRILNDRFHDQYHRLMHVLSHRRNLNAEDLMSVTYYMLLQDRVGEALEFFKQVNSDELETRLQHDYFTAYLDCYSLEPIQAPSIVARYADYPVPRWQAAFDGIRAMLDEVAGRGGLIVDDEDRNQQQDQLAAAEPNFEFEIESGQIILRYQNVDAADVNFYLMDLELLFSRNPFAEESSEQFSLIQPNHTESISLPDGQTELRIDLPEQLRTSNVLVEVVAGGKTRTQTYYANSMNVRINENYGQVRVTNQNNQPAPQVYVKAYARTNDGRVRFYKDGYTDLRGKFDFASLNTNEIEQVERFSLLVMSDDQGAVVREARPPKR